MSIFRRLPRIRRSSDRPLGRRALTALLASAVIVVIPLGSAGVGATAGTVAHASGSAIEGQHSGTTSTAIAAAAPREAGIDGRAPELTTANAEAWLDGLLPSMLQREGITGAVVSVVSHGEVVTQQGYGSSEAGTSTTEPRPVDAGTTLFRIGSVSKLVTATAVMQLVDQGRVDLDEPVQNYVDIEVPNRFDRPITLRHLLSHTAGLEDEIGGLITSDANGRPTLREALASEPPEQIFEPGTTPAYSNYSNGLAAYVVERVTGQDFEVYATENILEPAGMTTATYAQPLSAEQQRDMSRGYDFRGSEEVPFEVVTPSPAGAISATATDMSRFMLAQLGHSPVLSPAMLELIHEPALGADTLGGLAEGPRMTLGFFERDRNGHRILSHAGDLTAFHAQLEIFPDDDAGIFISLNSTGVNGDATTAIRDAVTTGFADRYFPDTRPAPAPIDTAAAHAEALAGTYEFSRRGESTFIRLFFILSSAEVVPQPDGSLTVSAIVDAAGQPLTFVEVEPWVWQERDGQRRIAADVVGGEVRAISFDPAFTLQPMSSDRAAVPLIAAFTLVVLAIALVSWPVGAGIRRYARRPSTSRALVRRLRLAVHVALLALVAAVPLWMMVAEALLTDSGSPGAVVIRGAQVLTAVAALGVVPAAWLVVETVRSRDPRRASWWLLLVGRVIVALAFLGLGYLCLVGGILQPSLSY